MIALLTMIASALFVVAMGYVAYREENFTKYQMIRRAVRLQDLKSPLFDQLKNGLPFVHHSAMWSDLSILSIALGLVASYWKQWTVTEVAIALAISIVATLFMHAFWAKMTTVQEHILGPSKHWTLRTVTRSGWMHVLYMTMAHAMLVLFYFMTESTGTIETYIITGFVIIHVWLANALVGKIKSGKFDAPAVILSGLLTLALIVIAKVLTSC